MPLLGKSRKIFERTKVNVVSPVDLLIRLRELSERQTSTPTRVSGHDLEWRSVASGDLAELRADSFLRTGERKSKFVAVLETFLLDPQRYTCELLRSKNEVVAIRILERRSSETIVIHAGRVTNSPDQSMFGRFLVADTVSGAVEQKAGMVVFSKQHLAGEMIPDLIELGFVEHEDDFVRFCFSEYIDRKEASRKIGELSPESSVKYRDMPDVQLERWCSPLGLENTSQDYFLIPIRPGYAMNLFDRNQSSDRFFRWKNQGAASLGERLLSEQNPSQDAQSTCACIVVCERTRTPADRSGFPTWTASKWILPRRYIGNTEDSGPSIGRYLSDVQTRSRGSAHGVEIFTRRFFFETEFHLRQ